MVDPAQTVHIMNTYARFPVTVVKGEGAYVYGDDGKKYLDFGSGISVNNLGHCHPAVVKAIQDQAATLCHCSNLYWSEPQLKVADYLTKYSGLDRVFFCNSGAEANEGAVKLARKYFYDHGKSDKYEIITMKKSFHGRTLATLTATGQDKVKMCPRLSGLDAGNAPFAMSVVTTGICSASATESSSSSEFEAMMPPPI